MKEALAYSMDVSAPYRYEGGRYLAELRRSAGFTGADVGRELGVTRGQVSMWETGRTPLRPTLVEDMAKLYGVKADEMAKTLLKHSNPVMYALIFGYGRDKALKKVVEEIKATAEGTSKKNGVSVARVRASLS